MHKKLCQGKKGLCDAMRPTKGTELLQYLKNVEFEGEYLEKENIFPIDLMLIINSKKYYFRFEW